MEFSSLGPETLKHLQYVGQFHTMGIIPSKMPTVPPLGAFESTENAQVGEGWAER